MKKGIKTRYYSFLKGIIYMGESEVIEIYFKGFNNHYGLLSCFKRRPSI